MDFDKLLEELDAFGLSTDEYAIFGGGPLAVRGLRKTEDLDLIVTPEVFSRLKERFPGSTCVDGVVGVDTILQIGNLEFGFQYNGDVALMQSALNHSEVINGHSFVTLDELVKWKKRFGRPKDLRDVELIEEFLSNKGRVLGVGAEAVVSFVGGVVVKDRVVKGYRHPVLDRKLRRGRTKREVKVLQKARDAGVSVPLVVSFSDTSLQQDFVSGSRLSEVLDYFSLEEQKCIMSDLGVQVSLLHDAELVHGDLTTSNVMLRDGKVVLIDFGLGFVSRRFEDMAVDIHLLKQALHAKHVSHPEVLFDAFLKEYNSKGRDKVLERLAIVERRRRYRH